MTSDNRRSGHPTIVEHDDDREWKRWHQRAIDLELILANRDRELVRAQEAIDALKSGADSVRAMLAARVETLEAEIASAPHTEYCDVECNDGACTCWKERALGGGE